MSSTQHQLIEQCATRLRGIVEALDNIHDTSPHRWSTDLDDVHSSAESLLALIKDQAPTQAAQGLAGAALAQPSPAQAEAERPDVVGYRSKESGMVYEQDYGLKNPEALTTVAECERIVGALRAENAKLIEALDESDGDRWRLRSERDAALARVAELEMLLRKLSTNGLMQFSTADEEMAVQAALGGAPVAQAGQVPQAWLDVQTERRRQITVEGFDTSNDDGSAGQIALAAGCYALHAGGIGTDWPGGIRNGSALFWPWDEEWWKPKSARENLVRAGALVLAEIERLDRAGISQSPQPGATTASS